jgi:phosphohistidine phosphatase
MNLILWRHAQAEDGPPDLERHLTDSGLNDAALLARWLHPRLPKRFAVLSSPAARAQQTASALSAHAVVDPRLGPDRDVADYIAAADWPEGPDDCYGTLVIVGHQPILGRLAALLLCGSEQPWSIRKGALWWLSRREREARDQTVLRMVIDPDHLRNR